MLHNIEFISTLTYISGILRYPYTDLDNLWQDVLLNQVIIMIDWCVCFHCAGRISAVVDSDTARGPICLLNAHCYDLSQFHDVLPGSAIEMVNDDAKEIYARVEEVGGSLLRKQLSAMLDNTDDVSHTDVCVRCHYVGYSGILLYA